MLKSKALIATALTLVLAALPNLSHAEIFDIEAQSLATALSEFARQSGQQLFFSPEIVARKNSPGVKGTFAPMEALSAILRDTGVSFSTTPNGAILLRRGDSAAANETPRIPVTLAHASEAPAEDKQTKTEVPSGAADGKVQEVMVTGTRIKAASDRFSPVVQISRDDMDLAGHATVGDAMGALPQNFGGGVSLDTVFSGSSDGPGAVAINLRGLGNGATLTLLNGRRLAPGGMTGSFVDISSIPSAAIERVDIMTDGASAIYGSDAVAGVVNIVLRDDFQGAESRVGASTLTEGDSNAYSLGQTFGFSRERAHGLLTYEYANDGELNAKDREWAASMGSPTWLLPAGERHAVFASLGGRPAERVKLSLDAYYNKRATDAYQSNIAPVFSRLQTVDVEQLGAAAGMSVEVFSGWEAEVSAAYSRSQQDYDIVRLEVPPGAPGNRTDALTQVYSADASLGGSLFELPGGAMRGVFGAHYRKESADQMNFNTTSGAINFDVDKSRKVSAAFGEIYAPLLTGSARRPDAEVLTLSLAARYEDYNDVGSTSDARAGINWSVVEGLNLRATYGTSFRAPRLDQLRDVVSLAALVDYLDPQAPGGQSVALYVFGSSSDLKPEEADTWTAGFDLRLAALDGLSLRATYFNVDYDGRVGTPDASTDAQFRFFNYTGIPVAITGATAQAIASSALTYLDFTFGARSLNNVTVLLSSVPQNLTSSEVSGVDVDVSYDLPVSAGDLNVYLNSTYLTSFTRRVTPLTPLLDLRNTFSNPVDLKLRAGMQLRNDTVAASMALNYIDAYRDQEVASGPNRIGSWTTVDASMRLELGSVLKRPWAQTSALTLSVNNLLDRAPPRVAAVPLRQFPFDAANSDPSGRRIGLLWTTHW